MRFLLDAMLPRRLARRLVAAGHDAVHTLDLSFGNRTPDRDTVAVADRDARAVMTKDADFVSSHVIAGRPSRPALMSTGNIGNDALARRLFEHLAVIEQALMERGFVEPAAERLVIHESERAPRSLAAAPPYPPPLLEPPPAQTLQIRRPDRSCTARRTIRAVRAEVKAPRAGASRCRVNPNVGRHVTLACYDPRQPTRVDRKAPLSGGAASEDLVHSAAVCLSTDAWRGVRQKGNR